MDILHSGFNNIYLTASGNSGFASSIPQPWLDIVLGLGIASIAIIFIAGLIYIFKSTKGASNRPGEVIASPVNQVNNATTVVQENQVNDHELVAVITAAIMAYVGDDAPADGLVVRSIRRSNKNWKNA